jgi:hypothetical protein
MRGNGLKPFATDASAVGGSTGREAYRTGSKTPFCVVAPATVATTVASPLLTLGKTTLN